MEPTTIDSKNWLAFPVAPLTPSAPDQQKWAAVLSGIAAFELGGTASDWTHDALRLTLDDMVQAIFTVAERAPSAGHHLRFVVEHTANFAAINSMAVQSGREQRDFKFAIEAVETNIFGHTIQCFDGLTIRVAAANEHAGLLRVGFQSTLTGWIREFRTRDELG
jgi:hypothetical protein